MSLTSKLSTAYGKPNAIDTDKPALGCFLSEEAVEAGKLIGVIKNAWPAEFSASQTKYKCKLTEKTGKLFIAEVRHGTDQNVFRNMAVALHALPLPA